VSDDKLVKRGELILLISGEEDPEEELGRMNEGKVGCPFTYTDSLIWALAVPGASACPTGSSRASPGGSPASWGPG